MEFRITFYTSATGEKPLAVFLSSLKQTNPVLHKLVVAGILKLGDRANHGRPLTAAIVGSLDVMELRIGRTDIARVFFFFQPNREIVCTHGYVKKSQQLDGGEVHRAERYRADWEKRHETKPSSGF